MLWCGVVDSWVEPGSANGLLDCQSSVRKRWVHFFNPRSSFRKSQCLSECTHHQIKSNRVLDPGCGVQVGHCLPVRGFKYGLLQILSSASPSDNAWQEKAGEKGILVPSTCRKPMFWLSVRITGPHSVSVHPAPHRLLPNEERPGVKGAEQGDERSILRCGEDGSGHGHGLVGEADEGRWDQDRGAN